MYLVWWYRDCVLQSGISHITTQTRVPNISALVTATGYRLPASRDQRELDFHLDQRVTMLHHLGLSHFTFTKKPHKGCSKFFNLGSLYKKHQTERVLEKVRSYVMVMKPWDFLRSGNPALWSACSLSWWIAKIDPSCMLLGFPQIW